MAYQTILVHLPDERVTTTQHDQVQVELPVRFWNPGPLIHDAEGEVDVEELREIQTAALLRLRLRLGPLLASRLS